MEPTVVDTPGFEEQAGFFSRATLSWFFKYLRLGGSKVLTKEDLGRVYPSDDAQIHSKNMEALWNDQVSKKGLKDAKLTRVIFKFVGGGKIFCLIISAYITAGSEALLPLVNKRILEWLAGTREMSNEMIWAHVALIAFVGLAGTASMLHGAVLGGRNGAHIYAGITQMIFKKALRLSPVAKNSCSTGRLVNLMANDAMAVQSAIGMLVPCFTSVPQLLLVLGLLFTELGLSMLAGLGIFIPFGVVVMVSGTRIGYHENMKKSHSDGRLKITTDTFNNIRVIKPYAWETAFTTKLKDLRAKELVTIRKQAFWEEVNIVVLVLIPMVLQLTVFSLFVAMGNNFTSAGLLTAVQYFSTILLPLGQIPSMVSEIATLKITFTRLSAFLKMDESEDGVINVPTEDDLAISVSKDAIFQWEDSSVPSWRLGLPADASEKMAQKAGLVQEDAGRETTTNFQLSNISFSVKQGQSIAIVGPVGSGKTSLLEALLGQMHRVSGSVGMRGSIAYAMQQAWIMSATVRDNILFGSPYDEDWFETVIEASALVHDIEMMDGGEFEEIGDKGINLSGGQKARVGFARALYSKHDVVFLDDPLAAVDMHVGDTMFDKAICQVMAEKTVVLVTNQVHRLGKVDLIVVLTNGTISESGTFKELLAAQKDFAKLLVSEGAEGEQQVEEENGAKKDTTAIEEENGAKKDTTAIVEFQPKKRRTRQAVPGKKLLTEEESNSGFVSAAVYIWYARHCSFSMVAACTIFNLIVNSFLQGSQFVIAGWGNNIVKEQYNPDFDHAGTAYWWIGVYGLCTCGLFFFVIFCSWTFIILRVRSARGIHQDLMNTLIKAPVGFFDITPVGQVLTRCSTDTMMIDLAIAQILKFAVLNGLLTAGALMAIVVSTRGWLAPFLGFAGFTYFRMLSLLRKSAIQIIRLTKIAQAPLTTNFAQVLSGSSIVRAHRQQERFQNINVKHINLATVPHILGHTILMPYVMSRVGVLCALATAGSAGCAVIAKFYVDGANAGLAGAAFTFSASLKGYMIMLSTIITVTENMMTSVERVYKFVYNTPSEAAWRIDGALSKDKVWPNQGTLKFTKFVTGYRDGPNILKGITAEIKQYEKIGVVGRSGSGKSTIIVSLFRLIEPRSGTIQIDGVDISKIGLHDLRGNLGLIPQDPVMFFGTVKYNIDPTDQFAEDQLWNVLKLVNMSKAVQGFPQKLEHEVQEGGGNFSLGERQLICIARSLVSNPRILCLDEATASVDNETDSMIQELIRSLFNDKTVITIAHRLETIMDSDRIMVLDKGCLAEYGPAISLMTIEDGIFAGLVNAGNALNLIKIAKHGYSAKVMCV